MTIQRYTGENVEFHATGDMVAYEDYAELKEEYERLDKSHSAALAKIDALAAENAALKQYIDDKCYITDPKGLGAVIDAESNDVETPDTDAILSSLHAEGVEMAIEAAKPEVASEFQRETFDQCVTATVKYPQSDLAGKVEMLAWLEWFADQLRSKSEVQP